MTAPPDAKTSAGQPPLFTRLAKSLDLGVTYALVTAQPGAPLAADVAGQISAALQIKAGEKPDEGWTKTLPLEPAAITFTGPTAAARVNADFPAVLGLIDAIERETDFKPAAYEVAVIPTVRVTGSVGPQAVDETFAPAFTMKLNRTQITLDPDLRRSEVKSTKDNVPVEQYLDLPGLSLPVPLARYLTAAGTALAVLAAAVLAAVIFLGLGRDEAAKIRARYGTMLVSVAEADLNDDVQQVEVASIHDLARLAKRDGGAIFQQELAPGLHLYYFVPEGTVTYEYVVANGAGTPGETAASGVKRGAGSHHV